MRSSPSFDPRPVPTVLTDSAEEAASFIRRGELAAFPTETVYGLGASVYDEAALAAIYAAKERPADNPLIAHIHDLAQIENLATSITPSAQTLIEAFFPGPLTVILTRAPAVPAIVSAGLDTIAIRMPAHNVAQAFLTACEAPVAAPSANRSGRPSPTSWQDVYADLKGRIACILKGDLSDLGLESTVVDCSSEAPRVLRAGAISYERILEQLPGTRLANGVNPEKAISPGLKYRHYAPMARVCLVVHPSEIDAASSRGYIGLNPHPYPERFGLHLTCGSVDEYAHELFRFFRRCDRAGLNAIYCQLVPREGLGLALMDRIERAIAR